MCVVGSNGEEIRILHPNSRVYDCIKLTRLRLSLDVVCRNYPLHGSTIYLLTPKLYNQSFLNIERKRQYTQVM